MADGYLTIAAPSRARFTEKMSRFLAFASPAETVEEAKDFVAGLQKEFFDARHVCWAWVIGAENPVSYSNDNGEPSGTAGKPILGQINSKELRNVVVAVVRYFGGIKLGTPGLIAAYRESARLCLDDAEIIERHREETLTVTFPYQAMNGVMQIVKHPEVIILDREFDNTCRLTLRSRADLIPELRSRLEKLQDTIVD
ncbi:MAG: IMPACT family protein [Muribaculaceae bacterium]|nr:IMPACT family protein [Muribaculaceae bacterium]MDE7111369.1 IMPACT family protein [Muribaculaceae bacterium]